MNLDGLLTDAERQRCRALWRTAVLTRWTDRGPAAVSATAADVETRDWLPAVDRAFQP